MNKIQLVGDIHGHFGKFQKIIENFNGTTIQLGDLGIGFPQKIINPAYVFDNTQPYTINILTNFIDNGSWFYIRGNHDSPNLCRKYKNYLGEYGIFKNLFFVSGAWSIDREFRKENVDWWADEELSINQLHEMLDLYEKTKPEIVISHECPSRILKHLHSRIISTRTGQALDGMLEIHVPNAWYFGHHHKSFQMTYENKCHFQCLNSNETVKI